MDMTKLFLRIDSNAENSIISMLITAARQLIEAQTGVYLVSRNFKTFLPRFPGDGAKWWDGMIDRQKYGGGRICTIWVRVWIRRVLIRVNP